MQRPQLELWSAEPHPTARIYPQLTPEQPSQIVGHLAQLILKMVQEQPIRPDTTQGPTHER